MISYRFLDTLHSSPFNISEYKSFSSYKSINYVKWVKQNINGYENGYLKSSKISN